MAFTLSYFGFPACVDILNYENTEGALPKFTLNRNVMTNSGSLLAVHTLRLNVSEKH
jgi:hypothetical protein